MPALVSYRSTVRFRFGAFPAVMLIAAALAGADDDRGAEAYRQPLDLLVKETKIAVDHRVGH